MKWASLIVALMLGGFLLYGLFLKKAPEGTPQRVAEQFYAAAIENDAGKIRALCVDSAAAAVLEAGQLIFATKPEQNAFNRLFGNPKWKPSETKADFALTSAFSGKIMTIEFTEVGEDWKISAIAH